MGTIFTVVKSVNIKGQGVLAVDSQYQISGIGFGKKRDGIRREFWVILNRYDPDQKPFNILRSDFEKICDSEVVKEL